MKNLGEKIRSERIAKSLSQTELAKLINVSQKAIDFWEKNINEPKASYISQLSIVFNVSTDYLLGIEDEYGNKISDTAAQIEEPKTIKLPVAARSKGNKLRNITLELTEEQLNKLIAEIKKE